MSNISKFINEIQPDSAEQLRKDLDNLRKEYEIHLQLTKDMLDRCLNMLTTQNNQIDKLTQDQQDLRKKISLLFEECAALRKQVDGFPHLKSPLP